MVVDDEKAKAARGHKRSKQSILSILPLSDNNHVTDHWLRDSSPT